MRADPLVLLGTSAGRVAVGQGETSTVLGPDPPNPVRRRQEGPGPLIETWLSTHETCPRCAHGTVVHWAATSADNSHRRRGRPTLTVLHATCTHGCHLDPDELSHAFPDHPDSWPPPSTGTAGQGRGQAPPPTPRR